VIDPLAVPVLEGKFKAGDTVLVDAADGEITFRAKGAGRRRGAGPRKAATSA
jgi:hypothetical protein